MCSVFIARSSQKDLAVKDLALNKKYGTDSPTIRKYFVFTSDTKGYICNYYKYENNDAKKVNSYNVNFRYAETSDRALPLITEDIVYNEEYTEEQDKIFYFDNPFYYSKDLIYYNNVYGFSNIYTTAVRYYNKDFKAKP